MIKFQEIFIFYLLIIAREILYEMRRDKMKVVLYKYFIKVKYLTLHQL